MARAGAYRFRGKLPGHCAYCRGRLYSTRGETSFDRATMDHILPRSRGQAANQVRNLRLCCERCNVLRARLGHCCGALLLALGEARRFHYSPVRAAKWLGVLRHG